MKFLLALTLCTVLGTAAYAQRPPASQQPEDQQSQSTTVTGCLTKGASTGEYIISDSKTGEKLTFAGPDRLESYVNHTVQLTGKMIMNGTEKSFQPQSIKTVSNSCEGGGGR
jgi:hypothetical protein